MRVVVCIKQVADPEAPPGSFTPDSEGRKVAVRRGTSQVLSTYDENALEAALRIKDASSAVVTLLSVGPEQWQDFLQEAMGSGADEAVLLSDPATSAPKWKWSAGVQYTATIHGRGSLTPRLDVSHNGRMFEGHALGRPYFLPGYTLANARLTWRNQRGD